MDSNVKSLVITGAAAEDATKFRQKGSRRKRILKDDDFIENVKSMVPSLQAQAQIRPQMQGQMQAPQMQAPQMQAPQISLLQVQAKPIQVVQAQVPQAQGPAQQAQQLPQPISNVILKPLKQPRVKLQPKTSLPSISADPVTRKARRIHLSVGNLTHRFTRAKRVKDDTEKKSMLAIREYLVNKGVIQQKSKAPEKMLRSMYSDFMLLKDQAL